jgi:hypothetical protein
LAALIPPSALPDGLREGRPPPWHRGSTGSGCSRLLVPDPR